ncbi:MAG TPA: hypothetical protein VEU74_12045 [Gemmatimonadales bacterium]|nr:hypothetical protein [Gemmatimonadales bacterium]
MEPLTVACQLLALFFLGLGALGGAAAGFCIGLYKGEKGRRQAAESLLVLGVPEPVGAKKVFPHPAPHPIEPAAAPKGWDAATVERGMRSIQDEARAMGVPPPNDDEARTLALQMLSMAETGAGADDISIPGA